MRRGVVTGGAGGLLEGSGLASFPLQVAAFEFPLKDPSWSGLQEMPPTDEVEGGISWPQTADIENAGQSPG